MQYCYQHFEGKQQGNKTPSGKLCCHIRAEQHHVDHSHLSSHKLTVADKGEASLYIQHCSSNSVKSKVHYKLNEDLN